MSILTVSESKDIQSPPGNSLALFLDKFGNLQLKDVNGKTVSLSQFISSSGGGTPTLPDVFLGTTSRQLSFDALLNNFNLTVAEGTIPILFFTNGRDFRSNDLPQVPSSRYLWKLGAGEFFPIGSENISSKLELIDEKYLSNYDLEAIITSANAEEVPLGVINENFITYMNANGPYVFIYANKTYVITFTQNDIDYAYIFQGTLGTYGSGQLQFVSDDFIFIYQSTNAGEPTNSTYIRITRAEAVTLKASSSFVPGAIYVITDADTNLYGGTEVTLTAITSNQLSLQGSGLFYCPKYDLTAEGNGYGIWTTYMEGSFSNILGTFTKNETVTAQNGATAIYLAEGFLKWVSGDWSAAVEIGGASGTCEVFDFVSPSYAEGEIVHWGGKSWKNLNSNVGINIDKYTLDSEWELIPFNEIDYNVYVDEIQYDFENDMIIYRKDRYNNVVSFTKQVDFIYSENPIKNFQWGCGETALTSGIGLHHITVINSLFQTINFRGYYIKNIVVTNRSTVQNLIFYTNAYLEEMSIDYSNFDSVILKNNFGLYKVTLKGASLNSILFNCVSIISCTIYGAMQSINSNSGIYDNLSITKTIFSRQDGTPRLQYVNNSDVIVITDIDA